MIQQKTGFVPWHTGQNHCPAVVIGWIKHIITHCKCKITTACQWDPTNHQNLEWSLQNEAMHPFVCLLSGWSSYVRKRLYVYTLKQVVCLSNWSISLGAPSGSIRRKLVKAYFRKAGAPLKLFQKEKAWISSNNSQVIHGATAQNAAFKIIIWAISILCNHSWMKIWHSKSWRYSGRVRLEVAKSCWLQLFCSSVLQWTPEQLCIISASQNTAWVMQFMQKVPIFSFSRSKRGVSSRQTTNVLFLFKIDYQTLWVLIMSLLLIILTII